MGTITVIASKKFFKTPEGYVTTGGFGKVLEAIASEFDHVTLAVPVKHIKSFNGYKIQSVNLDIEELPFYESTFKLILTLPFMIRRVNKLVDSAELVHGWLPGYETWFAYRRSQHVKKKMVVYMGGDWEKASLEWKSGGFSFFNKLVAHFNEKLTRVIVSNTYTFCMGKQLYDKYKIYGKTIYQTSNSTLHLDDISSYRQTCKGKLLNILMVGRLSKVKNLPVAKKVLHELVKRGISCKLTVVGEGPLNHLLSDPNIDPKGFVPQGGKLTSLYDTADIFFIPSYENSVAKVVFEAMSRSIPVICSDKGVFPAELSDGDHALLCDPDDVDAFVKGILKIKDDDIFRKRIVTNSLVAVKNYTIDAIIKERFAKVL